jgi:trans-aconitate methyltransferase
MNLKGKKASIKYYDEKYSNGYMYDWPIEKKQRVFDIIKHLDLPAFGSALDYGCGNGAFTEVLRQALPKWNVSGTDISSVAIENAKNRFPNCSFFVTSDKNYSNEKFDFLFSHHVLEHVYNIYVILEDINRSMKRSSTMLHILPCGNDNSFEYKLCALRKDGINKDMENRFFFEDPGHVRRLTTLQLNSMLEKFEFDLIEEFYSNQYYGAIDWITRSTPDFIFGMTDSSNAKNLDSTVKLRLFMIVLLFLHYLRRHASGIELLRESKNRNIKHYLLYSSIILYPISNFVNAYLRNKAELEWKIKKYDKNGSEMYLFYSRI